MLYLCCPYTHPDPVVREYRFQIACRVASKLMQAGIVVFSPLSHSVPIAQHGGLDELDHAFWMSMCLPFLQHSDELLILGLDGWERSEGVREELFFALGKNKPITLIEEGDIENLPKIPKTAKRFLQSSILTEVYDAN